MATSVSNLQLFNATLQQRINHTVCSPAHQDGAFVLYLPTVNLRKKHNPAFAAACHLANKHQVPVLVLAVVLDDAHLPSHSGKPRNASKPIVFTARRIAFLLEALQQATREWEEHGAGVAIRVHGPSSRNPHHLTLARKAVAVVTDEPFVHPYLSFVQSVERVAQSCKVPVYRVDGSTTVAPISKLQRKVGVNSGISYKGVPSKAWIWQKQTDPMRRGQVYGVVKEGHFDAPELARALPPNFFLDRKSAIALVLPNDWLNSETPCPGKRPWTVEELSAIRDLKTWVLQYPGIDVSVPPCSQTHGAAGQQRWIAFRQKHLAGYAKLRNNITKPHAVSRMSCYLNYGTVSIFQIVFELWQQGKGGGASKFSDEILKWREIGYVHAFGYPEQYNLTAAVPAWAQTYLSRCLDSSNNNSYTIEELESCTTGDITWNAMQSYLNTTGELHNNARMTWGKTVLHWQKNRYSVDEVLHQLVYLNDRYALDGLSPPSYAGLLWCFGWCDKPSGGGSIAEKPASRYRQGSTGFAEGKRVLLSISATAQPSIAAMLCQPSNAKKRKNDAIGASSSFPVSKKQSIASYFEKPSHAKAVG